LGSPTAEFNVSGLIGEPVLQEPQHRHESGYRPSACLQVGEGHAADTGFLRESTLREMSVPTSASKLRSKYGGRLGIVTNHDLEWPVGRGGQTMILVSES
jgi:hypothetical protein